MTFNVYSWAYHCFFRYSRLVEGDVVYASGLSTFHDSTYGLASYCSKAIITGIPNLIAVHSCTCPWLSSMTRHSGVLIRSVISPFIKTFLHLNRLIPSIISLFWSTLSYVERLLIFKWSSILIRMWDLCQDSSALICIFYFRCLQSSPKSWISQLDCQSLLSAKY